MTRKTVTVMFYFTLLMILLVASVLVWDVIMYGKISLVLIFGVLVGIPTAELFRRERKLLEQHESSEKRVVFGGSYCKRDMSP